MLRLPRVPSLLLATSWPLLAVTLTLATRTHAAPGRSTREEVKGSKHAQKGSAAQPAGKAGTAAADKGRNDPPKSSAAPATAPPPRPPPPPAQPPAPLTLPVQKATLDNGLRVVMNVDRTS